MRIVEEYAEEYAEEYVKEYVEEYVKCKLKKHNAKIIKNMFNYGCNAKKISELTGLDLTFVEEVLSN